MGTERATGRDIPGLLGPLPSFLKSPKESPRCSMGTAGHIYKMCLKMQFDPKGIFPDSS